MNEKSIVMLSALKVYEQKQEEFMNELENYLGDVPKEILTWSFAIIAESIKQMAQEEGVNEMELAEQFFEKRGESLIE